jgi:hypothetical protein
MGDDDQTSHFAGPWYILPDELGWLAIQQSKQSNAFSFSP